MSKIDDEMMFIHTARSDAGGRTPEINLSLYVTNAGLGTATARDSRDMTSGTGAARTLLKETNASAADTDLIMRDAENMTGT